MKISQIIDKINEKHLFVPAFQREYVWKKFYVRSGNRSQELEIDQAAEFIKSRFA